MTSQEKVLQILGEAGALITDSHIVYNNGEHGSVYINQDALFLRHDKTALVCKELAIRFLGFDLSAQIVVFPHGAGVNLLQRTAEYLQDPKGPIILSAYADAGSGDALGRLDYVIRRGYDEHIRGRKVLIVDDILRTGGTTSKLIRAVEDLGGNLVGVGTLVNLGGVTAEQLGLSPSCAFFSLVNINADAYQKWNCPLCKVSVPINTAFGKGKEFLSIQKLD